MKTVAESTGTVNFDQTLTDTRAIWREAVTAGDVELLAYGTARDASQSNGQTIYHIVNGHCDCRDYEKAPDQWCKHRLAHAIAKRAYPVAKAKLDAGTNGQATPAQPEAP